MKYALLLASILLSSPGCISFSSDAAITIVRNQASYDFDCAATEIKVAPIGKDRFTAEGCFKREIYICTSGLFLPDSEIECNQQITSLPSLEGEK